MNKNIAILALLLAPTAVRGEERKMVMYDFDADTVEGVTLPKSPILDAALKGTPAEKASGDPQAVLSVYEALGDAAGAHAIRLKLGSHLELAAEAFAALDWKALDAELGEALKAAPGDAKVAAVLLDYAVTLDSTYRKTRNRDIGAAAKALYTRYVAIPNAPDLDATKQKAADLDDQLKPSGPGGPIVAGSIDKSILLRHLRAHVAEIAGCYNRALAADPKIEGKVSLLLIVSSDGKLNVDAPNPDAGMADVARCLVAHARAWRFPPSVGNAFVKANYPIIFKKPGA